MTKNELIPYENEKEYIKDLRRVLKRDYEVKFSRKELKQVSKNIERVLECFL